MIKPGDIISYNEMCMLEGFALQRGMNFRVRGKTTVILMSIRKGAPYSDRIEDGGKILIYEGHDVPRNEAKNPKSIDQQHYTPNGKLTQNGKFYESAQLFKLKKSEPENVRVYEKLKDGIWVYNGIFLLVDSFMEQSEGRTVFKFKLIITDIISERENDSITSLKDLSHNRMIPTSVKLEVWKRDKGKCVQCGSSDNLHFDHILPFSKGGTSLKSENIQLLCARHNLQKRDRIE